MLRQLLISTRPPRMPRPLLNLCSSHGFFASSHFERDTVSVMLSEFR